MFLFIFVVFVVVVVVVFLSLFFLTLILSSVFIFSFTLQLFVRAFTIYMYHDCNKTFSLFLVCFVFDNSDKTLAFYLSASLNFLLLLLLLHTYVIVLVFLSCHSTAERVAMVAPAEENKQKHLTRTFCFVAVLM